MKNRALLLILGLTGGLTADAATYNFSANNLSATIWDNDLNGFQNTITVPSLPGYIGDVNLTFNLSGGYNGDLYAFVSHNNTTAILLNRVGRGSASSAGYPNAGFGPDPLTNAFTFDDQAGHDVHWYRSSPYVLNSGGQLTGSWQPDGRRLDPLSAATLFDGANRPGILGLFNGMDPGGNWTFFIADVSPLGESTLVSWGLEFSVVPEPTAALLLLSGLAIASFRNLARRRG